jgi:hypothetical protein
VILQVDSRHRIERPGHVTATGYLQAARCMAALEEQRLGRAQDTTDRLQQISARQREAVVKLFGEVRYQGYRARLRDAAAQIRASTDSHGRDDQGRKQVRSIREAAREKVRGIQAELKVDPKALKALQERRMHEFHTLFADPEPAAGATPSLATPNAVPADILTGRTNPWQAFTPPYAGWAWDYSWSRQGGIDPILSAIDDSNTGEVGSSERAWDNDAGDNDYLHLDYHNKVGVFYTIPITGLVESWIEVQSIASYHQVIHEDEWGWSSGFARVGSRVTMQVASPVPSGEVGARAFEVIRGGEDFSEWALSSYVPGNSYWGHLFSDRVYEAGQELYVLVGSHEYINESVDDVEYNDQVTYRWFIKTIWLRSSAE